jgi:hypothetical protein
MKSTDKFLIGIVGGVILLIVVAFAVAFLRPKPTYLPDDTPEGVAHNYLFALQQKDYARAYGYLSPTLSGYPKSAEAFASDASDYNWNFGDGSNTLQVESSSITGDRAVVLVRETVFYEGGLFNSSQYANTFEMTLQRDPKSGAWKIVESDSYWAWCWNNSDGCR